MASRWPSHGQLKQTDLLVVFACAYIYIYNLCLADFWSELVQNAPELVGDGPRHPPNTSGTLLGKHMLFSKNENIMKRPHV